ncbi:hypothetical protein [Saccharopolyspora hattusasensis]|uniref:hypothetical protein n=1 Tax=Saccharopolyspora hattusasensis TaxID=1128679 RepID=UPI003D96383D
MFEVQDEAVTGEPLEPDGAGEVRANFRRLEPGFAQGVCKVDLRVAGGFLSRWDAGRGRGFRWEIIGLSKP